MRSNLKRSLSFVFRHEGGWGNDPRDRGNWTSGVIGRGELKGTKYGIAAHVYPTLDIKNLTLNDAVVIYARDYAPKVSFDAQPSGVDHTQLDIAINAGPGQANKLQMRALGRTSYNTSYELAMHASTLTDKVAHIKKINALMLSFYQGLAKFPIYKGGWVRRNTEREAISVKWALEGRGDTVPQQKEVLNKEEKQAKTTSNKQAGGAAGSGAGGGGGASQFDWTQFDTLQWIVFGVFGAAIVGTILYLAWHAYRNHERAKAYRLVQNLPPMRRGK